MKLHHCKLSRAACLWGADSLGPQTIEEGVDHVWPCQRRFRQAVRVGVLERASLLEARPPARGKEPGQLRERVRIPAPEAAGSSEAGSTGKACRGHG